MLMCSMTFIQKAQHLFSLTKAKPIRQHLVALLHQQTRTMVRSYLYAYPIILVLRHKLPYSQISSSLAVLVWESCCGFRQIVRCSPDEQGLFCSREFAQALVLTLVRWFSRHTRATRSRGSSAQARHSIRGSPGITFRTGLISWTHM